MKTFQCPFARLVLFACVLTVASLWSVKAQDPNVPASPGTNTFIDTVNIFATDSAASETGSDPGRFTVVRSGPTNFSLAVFFHLSGTASNGVDYQMLGGSVIIPAGALSASMEVVPIDDSLVEGPETVVARIVPSPLLCPAPACGYSIGPSSTALVTIADNDGTTDTNRPPSVQLVSPADGAIFSAPATVFLAAQAFDTDGFVATVEFFEGNHSLGITTNNPLIVGPMNPFQLVWSNVPSGQYTLAAKATDDDGAMAVSAPVRITVGGPNAPTVINIYTRDDTATEIPEVPPGQERPQLIDPAVFSVVRSGPTNIDLPVFYRVGGTAQNGIDYVRLSGMVTIPAGSLSGELEVDAIDDFLVEGTETVDITIEPPICIAILPPPPGCYMVGPNGHASARIVDNDTVQTNSPPVVHIISPASGVVFFAPASIILGADAFDREGPVATVEFFEGEHSLGLANGPLRTPLGTWILIWSNVPPGRYILTAKATDAVGAMGVSGPVNIAVTTNQPPPPPPPTNRVPVVRIVARDPIASEGTNCWGPIIMTNANDRCINPGERNTATFVVTRSDGTNSDLTVRYSIGGTASNGIDYVELPGSVTIAAGRRSSSIVVLPIDDSLAEHIETVVLALLAPPPDPNAPPPFIIGRPPSAAALIVDNDQPRPPCIRLPDHLFHLCAPGTNGHCFRVEVSTNLVHWLPVCTNIVTDGAVHFVDPDAPPHPRRFYQALPELALPLE
jgi:hypothetical protein